MKQLLIATILLTAPYASAGGWFFISIGQPQAHSDPRAHAAAFTVQVSGCSAVAADVVATAEGLVNGHRKSVPIQLVQLTGRRDDVEFSPDRQTVTAWPHFTAAVPKVWPENGTWVIRVSATTSWRQENVLVVLGPDGVNRRDTQYVYAKDADLEAILRRLAADETTQLASAVK